MGVTFKYSASPFLSDKELEIVGSGLGGSNTDMVEVIFSIIFGVWLLRREVTLIQINTQRTNCNFPKVGSRWEIPDSLLTGNLLTHNSAACL